MPPAGLEIVPVTTPAGWAAAYDIRREVFVVGQDCPVPEEFDGLDRDSRHVLALLDGEPVGTARWRVVRKDGEDWAKLERFAVLEAGRGRGVGKALVSHLMTAAREAGHDRMVLHAQEHLVGFYEGFGFRAVGEGFEEAGIPHVRMASR
jgi:predicted GNAT family N-acyltransferase